MKEPSVAAAFDEQAGEVSTIRRFATRLRATLTSSADDSITANWSCSRPIQIFLPERQTRLWSADGALLLRREPFDPLPDP
jgi:hypothetical protein